MMTFSQRGMLMGNQIPDYLEYGWVCAPNAAGQAITANNITTLTIDTEIADSGNFGAISSNQITLQPGTYYFEAFTRFSDDSASANAAQLLSLYNVTDSVYVTRGGDSRWDYYGGVASVKRQFTIFSPKTFELRFLSAKSTVVHNKYGTTSTAFTGSTVGDDQRTTIKLWRLKETYSQTPIKIGAGNQWTSYAELRNLVAFNAVGQSITADTVATVQLTEETSDVDGIVVLSGNQFTLGSGTYFIELEGTSILSGSTGDYNTVNYWIRNITDNSYAVMPAQGTGMQVTGTQNGSITGGGMIIGDGVVQISGPKTFELQMLCDRGGTLGTVLSGTLSTANSNCLARIKIYKR